MIKYSDNLVLEYAGDSTVKVVQSKDGCDFITYLNGVKNDPKLKVCVQTDKFIMVESEGLKSARLEASGVILGTADGEYTLPSMRERGSLLSEPPVSLPTSDPDFTWEYDFSGKTINTAFSANMGLAASLVVLGENLVARSITNVLEMYGDSSTAKFAVTPKQFSLCQKAGKAVVKYWNSGEVLISGESGVEVAIKKSKQKIDVEGLEKRLTHDASLIRADLSSLKVKTFGKFVIEKLIMAISNEKIAFVTDSARKVVECPGLSVQEPISLEVMAKDLKYLVGKISINTMSVNNQTRYIIRTEDKEKVIYVLVAKTV